MTESDGELVDLDLDVDVEEDGNDSDGGVVVSSKRGERKILLAAATNTDTESKTVRTLMRLMAQLRNPASRLAMADTAEARLKENEELRGKLAKAEGALADSQRSHTALEQELQLARQKAALLEEDLKTSRAAEAKLRQEVHEMQQASFHAELKTREQVLVLQGQVTQLKAECESERSEAADWKHSAKVWKNDAVESNRKAELVSAYAFGQMMERGTYRGRRGYRAELDYYGYVSSYLSHPLLSHLG